MTWQDASFAAGSVCFSVALLPMVRRGIAKPPLLSSILTGGWLWWFAVAYGSLGLTFATITTCFSAALWTILAVQRARIHVSDKHIAST